MSDTELFKHEVGERVKSERKRLGLTQRQLCDIANISPPTMSLIEAGSRSPTVKFLNAFCAHGADLDYLVNGVPKRENSDRRQANELLANYQEQLDQLLTEQDLIEQSIGTALSTLKTLQRRVKDYKKKIAKLTCP